MSRPKGKKTQRKSGKKKRKTSARKPRAFPPSDLIGFSLDPLRTGMPALDSITGVKQIERGGKVIRIIKTTEMDSYDEPVSKKGRKPSR